MELKDNCAICRVSMGRNLVKRLVPCKHLLHAKCFGAMENNGQDVHCPICRSLVTGNGIFFFKCLASPGLGEQRLIYLENLIDEAKATIAGGDCARAIQHSSTYHAAVLEMADMLVGT